MTKRILILALALTFTAMSGCKKAEKKPDEALPDTSGNAQTTQDTNIQNKDLSFNAQGSDSGQIDGLESVHFDYDKSAITADGRASAQKDADWMKAHPDTNVQIEGHCDRHGSIEYNLALGERRAKTVRTYMINLGVNGKRLSTISYGKEKPLDSAETESADAKNRRANFVPQK